MMSGQIGELYQVQKKDIPKAGATLASAFQHDSVWRMFFKEEATFDQKSRFFESPIKYCFKYGDVYATSERLEGIANWVPGDYADMTIWRIIRSGMIISAMRAISACTKLARQQEKIFEPLQADRRENMQGRSYLYLLVLGVAAEFQGQGFGGRLVRGLIGESEQAGLPIYAETQREENVGWYEKLGFKLIKEVTLPIIELPQWELIREPGA